MPDIKLTDDPLTNIKIMTPLLDEKGRAAVSGVMFGMVLKERINKEKPDSEKELAKRNWRRCKR